MASQLNSPELLASHRRHRGCPECGKTFDQFPPRTSTKGPGRLYCSNECKRTFQNRQAVEGRAIIALAKGWRLARNHKDDRDLGAACFNRMVSTLDYMIDRDRREGRTTAMTLGYAAQMIRTADHYRDYSDSRWARGRREQEEAPKAQEPAADPLAALQAKLDDPATGGNERAVLQAALEIMAASA